MHDPTQAILDTLHRNLQSIWDSDLEAYRATTADDVSFFEWYISPQRIDGIDFHLRAAWCTSRTTRRACFTTLARPTRPSGSWCTATSRRSPRPRVWPSCDVDGKRSQPRPGASHAAGGRSW